MLAWLMLGVIDSTCRAGTVDVAPGATRLAAVLDSLDVETHWPAGVHVHWESGVPDGRPERLPGQHTHCSAFVAAAAKHLGVYILRPPEHPQTLLANAQYDWLASEDGRQGGWRPVHDGLEAQSLANQGELVLAAYRNHHDDKPGHIAVVRPSDKTERDIVRDGPQIAQAGSINYRSTDLRRGFAGHPAAWAKGELRYYAHAVNLP